LFGVVVGDCFELLSYLGSDVLSDKVLDVCGELLIVCDDFCSDWCVGLSRTELSRRCGNDG
jgi:hypothetical protein